MKKYLVILLLLAFTTTAQAQRFIGYASAGLSLSQIEGDDVHGFYKPGLNAGPGVMLPLDRKQSMSLSLELLYVQKGSRCSYRHDPFDTTLYAPSMFLDVDRKVPFDSSMKCRIALDYIQIPIIFRYEDMRSGCYIGAGFAWSRLVRAKELYNGFTRTTNVTSGTFKTSDWIFMVDAGIRLYKNLTLNVRWEYSMVPTRTMEYSIGKLNSEGDFEVTDHWFSKFHNHTITCRLTYYFNEKFVRNTKTKLDGSLIGTKWVRDIPDYN